MPLSNKPYRTNQTSLETLTPFLLLRYLPKPDPRDQPETRSGQDAPTLTQRLDHIPREHQLTAEQRRHVRYAHSQIRMYDIGWRENWQQVVGVGRKGWKGYVYRILYGGGGYV